MGETAHAGLAIPGHVILAREPDFVLGAVIVRPSTLQVELNGKALSLEPRMMQVLVALARADGQVVTREDLVELCWEGRLVGEDAINRVIWRLRQFSRRLGPGAFQIETIARVGFRIPAAKVELTTVITARSETKGVAEVQSSRRAMMAAGVAAVGLASLGALSWAATHTAHSPDPRAKLYFDRAMQLRGQAALSQSEQSISFLKEATRIDPDYADAWGALAWAYRSLLDYGPRADSKRLLVGARSAADRALELDPANADAAVALLELQPKFGRWGQREQGFRDVLARNPGHGVSEYRLIDVLADTGRWTETIEPLRRLAQREPFWPLIRWRLAESLLSADRVDEAEDEIESALRIWPRKFELWQLKVRLLSASGRDAEAVDFASDEFHEPADARESVECERTIAAAHGATSSAARHRAIDYIVAVLRRGQCSLCFPAMASAFIGEHDLAFEIFDGYYLGRGPWRAGVDRDPFTFPLFRFETTQLRRDAHFADLVQKIGLEGYWRTSGKLPDYKLA